MKIRTIYAKSMQAGLRMVKEQLGPDALILSSREFPSPGSGRRATGIEIVAALDGEPEPQPSLLGEASTTAGQESEAPGRRPFTEPEDFCTFSARSFMEKDHREEPIPEDRTRCKRLEEEAPNPQPIRPDSATDAPLASRVYQWLLSKEISSSLASRLLEEACATLPFVDRAETAVLQQAVAAAARKLVAAPPEAGEAPAKRIVFFVGPTGVGKTTSVAKLAARLALKLRRKTGLITLDGYRIGAVEQLRAFAGLMGVPFRFVQAASELRRAIEEYAHRDYILIDTVGHGPRNPGPLRELGRLLSECGEAEGHLVVSAATKPADIPEIIMRFDCCAPDHLLFTKLDETRNLGPILDELVRTGRPVRYYSDGQRVPEDFHVASRDRIVDLVLNLNKGAHGAKHEYQHCRPSKPPSRPGSGLHAPAHLC
ncbi:MAG: flagellar biosynthesis protein FlhF [Acidobacteria bacterium]|nr:flagellar biosynthesis protein FlhF [Acidobacteriota bacterium]